MTRRIAEKSELLRSVPDVGAVACGTLLVLRRKRVYTSRRVQGGEILRFAKANTRIEPA